ncbi:aspartic peptidase domain-containing protein [Suillus spraguei]|nr:aspartic peptidase domain-containing protein [Suillus spraguei]
MFLAASLLTQALLTLSITGSPVEVRNSPITIPLTRRLNFSNGTINLLQHDKARVAAFMNYNTHGRRADIVPVSCFYHGYTIAVGIGSPPTTYNLILDGGSSVTWLKDEVYVPTDTSVNTGRRVKEKYGNARHDDDDDDDDDDGDGDDGDGDGDGDGDDDAMYFQGLLWNDTVTIGGLTVTEFQLGIAEEVKGFQPGDIGILGIGPKTLSFDTLIDEPDDLIPTITDYLYDQGKINKYLFGIFFQPITTDPDSLSGELTFGEADDTKYTGNVAYTPITTELFASDYWGINQWITYGSAEILGITSGIVDTGTVFLHIASDAFEKYKAATGGTHNEATGLLSINVDQYNALKRLNFHIGGQIFSLTANAQIWPRPLNYVLDGNADPNAIYLIVKDIGTPSGQGIDFNLGHTFLQRFYTVFDRSSFPGRVGFAETLFTDATTN